MNDRCVHNSKAVASFCEAGKGGEVRHQVVVEVFRRLEWGSSTSMPPRSLEQQKPSPQMHQTHGAVVHAGKNSGSSYNGTVACRMLTSLARN